MKSRRIAITAVMLGLASTPFFAQQPGLGDSAGANNRGFGGGFGEGVGGMRRGIGGIVTEVTADHFTVKNETGELWTLHYSANTRVMKQTGAGHDVRGGADGQQQRTPPQPIKAQEIKAGDAVMAMGEVDQAAKSVGAVFIMQLDPQTVRRMQQIRADYGKTWLAGRITAIQETSVTVHGVIDNADHTFTADENTTFRRRRDPITLADMQVGENVRVEGAVKDGAFVAGSVTVLGPPVQGGPARRHDSEPPK